MRKVVLTLALSAAFGIAHAESGDNQLFDCMDAKTFEMNNQCMSDKIGNNIRFRDAQAKLIDIAS
ncbi:MAG: pyridine nucleotide transhydrogenase, partial [Pseudomonadota bacterium]|nr:pyridine nucleotide transhydrogenase [Pseudomonadota bacterium]MEC8488324.1 pyridine nucleotide transhydrogenase [Pseudomonadota bacterium]MEC8902915.1 pyridine nucleotide transhydrogenase [Pseudomonadota bacterium]